MISPLEDGVDHVRGPDGREAHRRVRRLRVPVLAAGVPVDRAGRGRAWAGGVRFAFRHFPLTEIHPHALAASRAAEAAALQGRFWEMHELLFHRQKALEDEDLRGYASELGLDVGQFDSDRSSEPVLDRIERDFRSGMESGEVRGTPTLFIDGVVHPAATTRTRCWS